MKKFGIKTKVFLNFSITLIFIVNIFLYLLYFFVSQNFKDNIYKNIINEYSTIKTFIKLQNNTNFFNLPQYEVEKINNLGFFFYIGKNDKKLQKNYKNGFFEDKKSIVFRGDYMSYNIIIGKKLDDFLVLKKNFLEIALFLNIFLIFFSFLLSYILTRITLSPLLKLSNFLENYDISKNTKLLKNKYGNSEIGILTQKINEFILEVKNTLESQKYFIQDASHELKTPLMQIDSNIELIEDKIEKINLDKKILQKLENIKSSTKNLNEIISDLNFILSGENKNLKKEKINIYKYLLDFTKKFEAILMEKNIKLKIVKNYDLFIEANKYYLDRLFGNLISNAIFYNNGNNNLKIIIDKNKVSIIDEGIGIEKDELDKIFNRFYRNKNSGIFYKNGNGLGLAIVKKILDIFLWDIKIFSEVGKGTNIDIIFYKNV